MRCDEMLLGQTDYFNAGLPAPVPAYKTVAPSLNSFSRPLLSLKTTYFINHLLEYQLGRDLEDMCTWRKWPEVDENVSYSPFIIRVAVYKINDSSVRFGETSSARKRAS